MSAEVGFIRSLQDDPFDATVRAIFGDWLEEQGDADHLARRRLLQLQTELDRWIPDLHARRERQLEEQALLTAHAAHWLRDLDTFPHEATFRACLVDVVFAGSVFLSKKFAAVAERLFDGAWLGRVRLEFPGEVPPSLVTPALAHVRQLDLRGSGLTDAHLGELLTSGLLENLVTLDLSSNQLTDTAAQATAAARWPRLQELDVRNNFLSRDGVAALHGAADLPLLRRLEVHGNAVPAAVIEAAHAWRGGTAGRLVNSVGMEFALVPAGTFLMGSPESEAERGSSEGPVHEVELSQAYYLSRYPVTQRQYAAVTGSNPANFTAGDGGGLDHPVECVSWGNATAFCELLGQREAEVAAGRTYRLPTEAQWEHACRAGSVTPFACGATLTARYANFDGRHPYGAAAPGPYLGRTSRVGSYPANAFGVYDMHGNVWEWCADYYEERYYTRKARRNPTGPRTGTRVATRGGSYTNHAALCRSASRDYWYGQHYSRDNIGFRVVLAVAPGISPGDRMRSDGP